MRARQEGGVAGREGAGVGGVRSDGSSHGGWMAIAARVGGARVPLTIAASRNSFPCLGAAVQRGPVAADGSCSAAPADDARAPYAPAVPVMRRPY